MLSISPAFTPFLDPDYIPAVLWHQAYDRRARADAGSRPLAITLERQDGNISRHDTVVLPATLENAALNLRCVERLLKFLLWSRGGARISIGGAPEIAAALQELYAPAGERKFDVEFSSRIYLRPFTIVSCAYEEAPAASEAATPLGRHLEGCRIGFDLGGSDRKCAAVIDGKVVFSEEVAWDPYFQSDPGYHRSGIQDSLRRAAAHLPRVDAIGGSAAGVYVDNEVRAASLFRGVPEDSFEKHVRRLFFDIQQEWNNVPFEVVNDGEVTALAGSMSLHENRVLGISMGTSVAAGYVNQEGNITSWLNELAFVPVDYRDHAPLDEWSGDRGCAVQYFCQQGVARLIPRAGIPVRQGMKFAEQLMEVQKLMQAGDARARNIYDTLGVCFGYAVAHFAAFYDLSVLLILGRVTSGTGGDLLLARAGEVLQTEFPEIASRVRLHVPGEHDKRHGQAIAAASLPALHAS